MARHLGALTAIEQAVLAAQLQELRRQSPRFGGWVEASELSRTRFIGSRAEKRGRGRPGIGSDYASQYTADSYGAFLFVIEQLQEFRRRVGKKRVPKEARDAFIEFSLTICPEARIETIIEHLRKSNRYGSSHTR